MARRIPTRIGVLGGTFNPVHLGHLILAQDAMEQFGLALVLFVPCNRPPHKPETALAPVRHRLAMLRLAVKGNPRFAVSDLEVRRGGISYTIDTARALRALHPGAEICFIIGSDSLVELPSWREIGELLKLCRFVTLVRPGPSAFRLTAARVALPKPWRAGLLAAVRAGHTVDISSTDIRRRAERGDSLRYLVPRAVEAYVRKHRLYAAGNGGRKRRCET